MKDAPRCETASGLLNRTLYYPLPTAHCRLPTNRNALTIRPTSTFRLGIDLAVEGPAGGGVPGSLGRRRNLELQPLAIGPLLSDTQGRPRPTPSGDVAWRGRADAVRSARRPGGDLPGAHRRLRRPGQLSVGDRRHRSSRHGGFGIGAAATAGEAGEGGAFRRGTQTAVARLCAANRGGH